jgi:hypothetical protein
LLLAFSVRSRRNDNTANALHQVNAAILARAGRAGSPLALNNVARLPRVDDRLQRASLREHYRVGDVSARILQVRAQLNTAIIAAGYRGGNAVHHDDEQGNMALAKGSLAECLPVVAMLPYKQPQVVAVQSVSDFRDLVKEARAMGYDTRAKPSWLREAGLA